MSPSNASAVCRPDVRPRVTQLHHLLEYAARWDDAPYLIQGDRTLSFAEVGHLVRCKAEQLTDLGVRPGERVFLLGWNGPEWVVNLWAALWTGAVPVLVNAWWSPAEVCRT